MNEQLFYQILRQNRQSITRERKVLFSILKSQDKPITMNDLVRLSSPTLNRSTVYRTIDTFEKSGIVTKVYSGWKYRIELSDEFDNHHHHLTCNDCGVVIEFKETNQLIQQFKEIEKQNGFIISSHSLELKGLCSLCCYNKNI